MKYTHIVLLALSIPFFGLALVHAQGEPPTAPPADGPAIPPSAEQPGNSAPVEQPDVATPNDESTTNAVVEDPTPAIPISKRTITRTVVPTIQRPEPAKLQSFKFESADLDTVLTMYCEWTGKTYLKVDNVSANISLKADKKTIPECINLVEAILAMNNIALVPMGDDVIKVVQANSADLTGQGGPVSLDDATEYSGSDRLVTQLIPLKNVQIKDIQAAVQHLMHAYGKIQTLEGSNSMLITDTEANIKRIRDLVDFVDQASARIEPFMFQIKYAAATDIASKLGEIIAAAQADQGSTSASRGTTSRTVPGVIRARTTTPARTTQATVSSTEGGAKSIIQGTVKVMADERTNLIILFSQAENYDFFEKIINTLDVEVEPATTFEVVNLEYADSADLAGKLNDLIGNARSSSSTGTGSSSRTSSANSRSRTGSTSSSSSRRTTGNNPSAMNITPNAEPEGTASIENLNYLSENTKILADERSNSILLMGRKSDIAAIKNVITSLDVMLEQVMIEADIFEIGLTKGLDHGIQWLYKSQSGDKLGAWDVSNTASNGLKSVASGALKYYQNVTGIDTEAAIKFAASDNNARVLGTPIIMTTDNTEATLSIGEQRPIVTSTDSFGTSSGTLRSSYDYKDIGIQLTVTPRINPQRFVVMHISQSADQLGGTVSINNNDVPIILNREFEADVAIPDRGTVALGGLMTTEVDDSVTKIPILGDIPLLGRYLFSSVHKSEVQRELLVLLTPYVMTTNDDMVNETERLYKSTTLERKDWNWSDSALRDIPTTEGE